MSDNSGKMMTMMKMIEKQKMMMMITIIEREL